MGRHPLSFPVVAITFLLTAAMSATDVVGAATISSDALMAGYWGYQR